GTAGESSEPRRSSPLPGSGFTSVCRAWRARLAARAVGLQIQVLNASTSREIDSAFATVVRERPDALLVGPGAFFVSRRIQLANLAARSGIAATYPVRDNVEAGGLMSYGPSLTDAYRQVGVYTGRVLKGAELADLPVVQSSKFEHRIASSEIMLTNQYCAPRSALA